jgi:hypothetical protein
MEIRTYRIQVKLFNHPEVGPDEIAAIHDAYDTSGLLEDAFTAVLLRLRTEAPPKWIPEIQVNLYDGEDLISQQGIGT